MSQISNTMFNAGKSLATFAGVKLTAITIGFATYYITNLAISALNKLCTPNWKMEDRTIENLSTITAVVVAIGAGFFVANWERENSDFDWKNDIV